MSIQATPDDRTVSKTPDSYQLAAELGVDRALMVQFVKDHPNPTAAIVLGWASRYADADPDRYASDVEEWLDARRQAKPDTPTPDEDPNLDDKKIGRGRWGQ